MGCTCDVSGCAWKTRKAHQGSSFGFLRVLILFPDDRHHVHWKAASLDKEKKLSLVSRLAPCKSTKCRARLEIQQFSDLSIFADFCTPEKQYLGGADSCSNWQETTCCCRELLKLKILAEIAWSSLVCSPTVSLLYPLAWPCGVWQRAQQLSVWRWEARDRCCCRYPPDPCRSRLSASKP